MPSGRSSEPRTRSGPCRVSPSCATVWNAFHDPELALRADDRLDADLCIECGDVDWELVASFADRSLDSHEASQRLDEADTIADVVHLLDALPRRAAA